MIKKEGCGKLIKRMREKDEHNTEKMIRTRIRKNDKQRYGEK